MNNPYEIEGLNRKVRLAVINDGLTEAQAAEKFHLKLSTVNAIMGNANGVLNGAKAQPAPIPGLTDAESAKMRARNEAILEEVRKGVPFKDIAAKFRLSEARVSAIACKGGEARRKRSFHKIPQHVRESVANMVREGATDVQAAYKFGVSAMSVRNIRLEFGLEANRAKPKPRVVRSTMGASFRWTPALRGKAVRLADEGVPYDAIAKAIGFPGTPGAVYTAVSRSRAGKLPYEQAEVIRTETTAELKAAVTGAQQVVEGSAVAKPNKGGFMERYERMTALKAAYDNAKRFIDFMDAGDEAKAVERLGAIAASAEGV